jgi:hypothetical protein
MENLGEKVGEFTTTRSLRRDSPKGRPPVRKHGRGIEVLAGGRGAEAAGGSRGHQSLRLDERELAEAQDRVEISWYSGPFRRLQSSRHLPTYSAKATLPPMEENPSVAYRASVNFRAACSLPPSGPASKERVTCSASGRFVRGTRTGAGQNVPQRKPDWQLASAGFASAGSPGPARETVHFEWFFSSADSVPQ